MAVYPNIVFCVVSKYRFADEMKNNAANLKEAKVMFSLVAAITIIVCQHNKK